MIMKRSRVDDLEVEELAMANCSKLLSRVGPMANLDGRVFECKICNKKFPSSQALGGHRARHKMPRLVSGDLADTHGSADIKSTKTRAVHGCSICGLEFAGGQALGGHMRRHRDNGTLPIVLKGSNSSKRVILCLDLNLTPYENDLKLGYKIHTIAPPQTVNV